MNKKLPILFALFAAVQPATAAIILFQETFNNATFTNTPATTNPVVAASATVKGTHNWTVAAYGSDTPAVRPTFATSVGAGNDYAILTSTFSPKPANAPWQGVQVQTGAIVTGLSSYALSDLTFSIRYAVTATNPGGNPTIGLQLRQAGHPIDSVPNGITQSLYSTSTTFDGTWKTVTFKFDQTAPSIALNSNPVNVLIEVTNVWGISGSSNTVALAFDDITITAVPEPSTALLGLAALSLVARRRRA